MQEDIRPLKGPAELWDWWSFLGWVLLSITAAALLFFLARFWRGRSKRGKPSVPEGPPKLPHEIALEALSRLEQSDLLRKRELKLFYSELSDILRRYLGDHFGVETLDRTTWEIYRLLKEAGISAMISDAARDILEEADLVKFAKYQPSPEAPLRTLEWARKLIQETTSTIEGGICGLCVLLILLH